MATKLASKRATLAFFVAMVCGTLPVLIQDSEASGLDFVGRVVLPMAIGAAIAAFLLVRFRPHTSRSFYVIIVALGAVFSWPISLVLQNIPDFLQHPLDNLVLALTFSLAAFVFGFVYVVLGCVVLYALDLWLLPRQPHAEDRHAER